MGIIKMLATRPAIKAEMAKREEFSKKILKDIQNVCHKRTVLKAKYGLASDDDLIESIIYEELALHSRYNYLVKIAKENGVKLDRKCLFVKWDNEV
ncbi:MAG: DUF2508 family protein [Clostridiales bacterium]|jgi:hypothetical protein|nr:DUF2508 family protein [Clostridiales bacterium]